jgi:hypothetical protein
VVRDGFKKKRRSEHLRVTRYEVPGNTRRGAVMDAGNADSVP